MTQICWQKEANTHSDSINNIAIFLTQIMGHTWLTHSTLTLCRSPIKMSFSGAMYECYSPEWVMSHPSHQSKRSPLIAFLASWLGWESGNISQRFIEFTNGKRPTRHSFTSNSVQFQWTRRREYAKFWASLWSMAKLCGPEWNVHFQFSCHSVTAFTLTGHFDDKLVRYPFQPNLKLNNKSESTLIKPWEISGGIRGL